MKQSTTASEKSKILMRTYVTSLLSLMLCVTMLLGTTYAWFTSEVTTAGNEIMVGTMRVDMVNDKNESLAGKTGLFGSGTMKWEPGATQIETVKVVNYGDLAFDYAVYLSTLNAEVGHLETVGKYIDVYITTNGATAESVQDLKDKWIRIGNLADVARNGYMLANGSCTTPAVKDETNVVTTVKIALHMPAEVTETSIMGKKITNLGIRLMASQKVYEEDYFGSGYDAPASVDVQASTFEELAAAITAGKSVRLLKDIEFADKTLTVPSGKSVFIDLNGNNIIATSEGDGKNDELFLVKGNLVIRGEKPQQNTTTENEGVATAAEEAQAEEELENTISYTYKGSNMGWNAMSTIFDITAGGSVQLQDMKAVHAGGTDMTFVAHLNNWGSASLYMDGAHLEAPYCAVRVFNSGNDMNNVIARSTTLKGGRAFWVHNYTEADFGASYDAEAIDARLNVDIWSKTNSINGNVVYGFTNDEYHVTGGTGFATAVAKGAAKIILQDDITIKDQIEIPAEQTVVVDLNGKNITGTNNLIENNGKLTIEGEGNIAVTYTGTVDNSKAVNAITNRGTLTVNGGKISNTGVGDQIGYAIDNHSGATLTVNGGEIIASGSSYYDAIRLFCGTDRAKPVTVTINGGKVSSIWAQNPTTDKATQVYGTVIVNGGDVTTVYYENYTIVMVADGVTTTVTAYGAGSEKTAFAKEGDYTVYKFN